MRLSLVQLNSAVAVSGAEVIERIQSVGQQSDQDTNESWLIKARRKASLLKEGLSGFSDAAHEAVSQHKGETAAKVAVSCGVGLGLAYLSRGRSLGPIAARSIGATSSLAFVADIGSNLTQIAGAMNLASTMGHSTLIKLQQ